MPAVFRHLVGQALWCVSYADITFFSKIAIIRTFS